jgi:microcystin-dependent protein
MARFVIVCLATLLAVVGYTAVIPEPNELRAQITGELPVGTIIPYAGPLNRQSTEALKKLGWLVCDGRYEDKALYKNLAAVIGTLYNDGGTPPTTKFRLPNLVGRVALGATTTRPSATGGEEHVKFAHPTLAQPFAPVLGQAGGSPTFSLSADMLTHKHAGISDNTGEDRVTRISGGPGTGERRLPETAGGVHVHAITPKIGDVTEGANKANVEHLQPYLPIHYLIRWKGPKM